MEQRNPLLYAKYPGIPVTAENDYVRELLNRIENGELGPDMNSKIAKDQVRVNDVTLFKRLCIHGKSSQTPFLSSSDQMIDGISSFNMNKIPKDTNMLLTHVSIKHAFSATPTTDPATNAQIATSFFHNLIPFVYNYVNAAAGTPTIGKAERDNTSGLNRVPEELLGSELVISVGGVLIFKRDVRSMFFDLRVTPKDDYIKGVELTKKVLLVEDQVVNATLVFPSGVTVPAYSSGAVSHMIELCLWGVGTVIKG